MLISGIVIQIKILLLDQTLDHFVHHPVYTVILRIKDALEFKTLQFLNVGLKKKLERCTFLELKTLFSFSAGKNV
jgi:hypothetical protein